MEAELNLDPDSNPDPESDPELITDPDPNLQLISDPDAQHCLIPCSPKLLSLYAADEYFFSNADISGHIQDIEVLLAVLN